MYLDCPPWAGCWQMLRKNAGLKKGGVSWRIMSGLDVEI